MRAEQKFAKDSASGVIASAPWRLLTVKALPGYRLEVTFNDGLSGYVDLSKLIFSDHSGVFSSLQDEVLFDQVFLSLGVATWPGGIDLAPDAMYEAIKSQGEWELL